jgi:hypothetical protein
MLGDEDTIFDVFCLRESKTIHNILSNTDVYFVFVFRLRCTERVIRIGIVPNGRGDNPLLKNFRGVRKIAKSDYISFVMYVCPSIHLTVRIEQLACHWTDFHET